MKKLQESVVRPKMITIGQAVSHCFFIHLPIIEKIFCLGIIVNQSVKGTVYVYLGVALGFLTTGILLPRIYTTEQVGLLKILVAYSTLIAQFGTLGITGAMIRFFPFFRNEEKKHHGFLALVLLVGLVGFLLSTSVLLISKPLLANLNIDKSAIFVQYLNYLIVLVFFQIFFSILDVYYTSLLNSIHGTFLREVFQKVLIILFIGLFFFDLLSFHQFVITYVFALSIPTVFFVVTLIRRGQFSLKTDLRYPDKHLVRSMVLVSAFSIMNGLTMIIIQNVDQIMINSMIGIEATGIYAICFFFGLVVSIPARSIYKIANVVSAEAWKNKDMKTIRDIYTKSCLTLFIIGLLLFLGLWINIENVFHILGKDYISGKWVILFIGLGSLIDMATGANSSILGTSKYYRVQTAFLFVLVLLLVATNLILIPIYGMTGAALGSVFSLTSLNILRYLYLYFKFGLQPYNIRFLWVIIIGATSYLIAFAIPVMSNYLIDILLRSMVLVFLFGLPMYYFKISEDINVKADEILNKLKFFK
jgi:O-antigen/teichoic acid export membrane protein